MTNNVTLTAGQKALQINLDDTIYGSFVEIGAGQEVARHFFKAGSASSTIAKTMSAYDRDFSNAIYVIKYFQSPYIKKRLHENTSENDFVVYIFMSVNFHHKNFQSSLPVYFRYCIFL